MNNSLPILSFGFVFVLPTAPSVTSVEVQRLNRTALFVTFDLLYTGGGDITTIVVSVNGYNYSTSHVQKTDVSTWVGVVVHEGLGELEYSTDLQLSVAVSNQQSLEMAMNVRQSFSK